jgi:hypothetical protein
MKTIKEVVSIKQAITKYVAEDGKEFDGRRACQMYEAERLAPALAHTPASDCRVPWTEDNYHYRWYCVKSQADLDAVCRYYNALDEDNDLTERLTYFPQWVCIQVNSDDCAWFAGTLDNYRAVVSEFDACFSKRGEPLSKADFVRQCGFLLRAAKPNLVKCEYMLGRDMPPKPGKNYPPEDEYVLITCENGAAYDLCVTANSYGAIAAEIFAAMANK